MGEKCYFIATSWSEGAIPSHFKALGNTLAARGNKVIFLTDGQRYDVVSPFTNPAIFTWPSRRPTGLKDALFLYRLIRRFRPDCLIAQFGSVNLMMLIGFFLRIPKRITLYHTCTLAIDTDSNKSFILMKLLRLRKRLIYNLAHIFVAVSQAAKEDLAQVFKIPLDKIIVFYNSLKNKNTKRLIVNKNNIVCVGRLTKNKSQDILIKSVAIIKNRFPEIKTLIIGEGPLRNDLLKLCKDYGVSDNIQFLGQLPHKVVLEKMASSYLTVVPSLSEAFGMTIIESMSVGTPVIASNVGGIPEIIRNGLDGFLVPPGDPTALAEKIIYLLENPEVRSKMGKNARDRFLSTFEQEKIIIQQVEWLEKIVD